MGVAYDLNALSGINAASNGLGVISNNLANSQSVGFKSSRAEFADMFSGAQNSPGNGVRVAAITQDFSQGSINGTGRELDMAIDGEGFFVLEDRTGKYDNIYSRNGSFKLDKEGYLTSQEGDRVQGYLLDQNVSTETNPVFSTALSSIDLDELNKQPKATSEMTYDINLDGEEEHNVDPAGTNTGLAADDDSVGSTNNLMSLIDPENLEGRAAPAATGPYQGSTDYFYPITIHDSLGGEHTLNASFYKRDVVPVTDSTGAAVSTTDANGNDPAIGAPVKYTSWLVQYSITDTDEQGNTVYTGHVANPQTGDALDVDGAGSKAAGQVYELRFDTNGNYLGAWEPIDYGNPTTNLNATTGTPDSYIDPTTGAVVTEPTETGWTKVAGEPSLNFIVDTPLTGATDPLGGPISGTNPAQFEINLDLTELTQFAGSYNQRGTTQNGYSIGDLVGLTTGLDGVIEARYSNGRSVPVAQLAIANFSDKNAMEKLGGQTYAESFSSGAVQLGTPQNNGMGSINAGSLEYSNVDVAGELVNMIQTQRTYQASAQVISTSQQLTQTILQL
ncbi:flagellar hook protein FlgE [Thiomicrorhabdus indica]|uniref:flagellar hook protein FlgE n=1 Tax=Thiomicrorhabdus indica TaxID=2267253 RepID=UPI002AA8CF13|nr:flagellar hook protein FlgE [Thiomicrorhabdus indica]